MQWRAKTVKAWKSMKGTDKRCGTVRKRTVFALKTNGASMSYRKADD